VRILGPLEIAHEMNDCVFVNGIGSPQNYLNKRKIIGKTRISLDRFETIIHPAASISKMTKLGTGVVVFQNVSITSNVVIGNHVIILPNTVISHDDVIGDYTCIAAGVCVSGGVHVGESCYLGSNSTIVGNISIGNNVMVGMGSVVLNDIPECCVVAGNPARIIRQVKAIDE
jgi:sugar O-acyltransferase (sialic acid O-acetyltransferase NeuD family)